MSKDINGHIVVTVGMPPRGVAGAALPGGREGALPRYLRLRHSSHLAASTTPAHAPNCAHTRSVTNDSLREHRKLSTKQWINSETLVKWQKEIQWCANEDLDEVNMMQNSCILQFMQVYWQGHLQVRVYIYI